VSGAPWWYPRGRPRRAPDTRVSSSPEPAVPFARLLRQLRVDAGLTQAALAEHARLSGRGVQRLEAGLGQPYPDTTQRLADALGLAGEARKQFEAAARPAPRKQQVPAEPTVSTAAAPRPSLPLSLTSFIGREREIADVLERLRTTRLLTLVGVGGIGKTRLALTVAAEAEAAQPDAACFVDFAPLLDPSLAAHTVTTALGVREQPGHAVIDTLVEALRSRQLLVVLDNCEHLVLACAELADTLLRACPNLRVLATSREALGIAGETVWRVPPLGLPSSERPLSNKEAVQCEAVRLFVERAAAASSGFAMSDDNALAIAEVCSRLDGIPLAIELAASRVPVLSVADIAARLDDHLRLLTGGTRTALPRQQTLRGTLDWSYALLSEAERLLFNRLAVFVGGWTLEAAELVCAGDGVEPSQVLHLTAQLVGKSMVVAEQIAGSVRYRLLETLRQYAAEKLQGTVDEPILRRRHLGWFLGLAERGDRELLDAEHQSWLRRLQPELDNFRAALSWSLTESQGQEAGLRLSGALGRLWWFTGSVSEGRSWLERLLIAAPPTAGRMKALSAAAFLRMRLGDPSSALPLVEEALSLARTLDDPALFATALADLGSVRLQLGDAEGARVPLEQALTLARQLGGWPRVYGLLSALGSAMEALGDSEQARAYYQEGLELARARPDPLFTSLLLRALGSLELDLGDLEAARRDLEEGLQPDQGIGYLSDAAPILAHLAGLAVAERDIGRAFRLAGAAISLREAVHARLQPTDLALLERRLKPAYEALDPALREAAWAEGAAMSRAEAVGYALQPSLVAHSRGPLTGREWEATVLLTQGLSNRELAARLVISEGTAKRHVENILGKLRLRSRAQLADWARQQGLGVAEASKNVPG
jgi:predicted ATPase/DNA-binding CsgD family transcriptional regulator